MIKQRIFILSMALVSLIACLSSCSDDEGPTPLRWKIVNGGADSQASNYITTYDYNVGAAGGEYNFICVNCHMLNFVQILDVYADNFESMVKDSLDYYTYPQNDSLTTVYDKTGAMNVVSKMAEATVVASRLNVKIKPNTSGKARTIVVGVMAIDAGTTFNFLQSAK